MENPGFVKAALAGWVVLFLLGFLTYGLTLAEFFEANMAAGLAQEEPAFVFIMLGELVMAVLLTMILNWRGVSNAAEGAKTAAVVGFMFTLSIGLIFLGAFDMHTPTSVAADVVVATLRVAVVGAVIGRLLGGGELELAEAT